MRDKGQKTRDKGRNDVFFILYLLVVLSLALIYFTVPERALFIENQIEWWGELWEVIFQTG